MLFIDHKVYFYALILLSAVQFYVGGSHTAFEWTTTQDIPGLLRLINPDFLEFDFYTNAIVNAPRYAFLYSIYVFQYIGLDWYSSLYLIKIFIVISTKPLLFLASYKIIESWNTQSINRNLEFIKITTFLVIGTGFLSNQFVVPAGWNPIETHTFLSPMTISTVFGLLYINFSLDINNFKSKIFGILCLSFATLLHPVIGLSLFLVKLIFVYPPNYKTELMKLLYTFLFGVILPIFLLKMSYVTTSPVSAEEFTKHYVILRHPHHYKMSDVLSWHYLVWCILFFTPFVFALFKKIIILTILSGLCFLYFTGPVLLQYIGTELIPLKSVAELGPSRFTIFSTFIWLCEILIFSIYFFKDSGSKFLFPQNNILRSIHLPNFIGNKFFFMLLLILIVIIWNATIKHPLNQASEETRKLLKWIKNNTATDSIFMVPKNKLDTFMLRVYGERAVFSDDAFPFNESFILEFSKRLALLDRFASLRVSDFKCLYEKGYISHILIPKNEAQLFDAFTPVYRSSAFLVYDAKTIDNNELSSCDILDHYMNFDIQGDIVVKQKYDNYLANVLPLGTKSNHEKNKIPLVSINSIELGKNTTYMPCGETPTEIVFCTRFNKAAKDLLPVSHWNEIQYPDFQRTLHIRNKSTNKNVFDDRKIVWSKLSYSASMLFLTFSADIQFSKASSEEVIPILFAHKQSKLPKSEHTYLLNVESENFGQKSRIDLWFDNDLTALQRMQIDTGHRFLRKTDRFLYNGLYIIERKPYTKERNLPPHKWNQVSEAFRDLSSNMLMPTISDEIVLFFALTASDIENIGDKMRFLTFKKNQINLISAEVTAISKMNVEYEQELPGNSKVFNGMVDTMTIEITARPFDSSQARHKAKIFGLTNKLVLHMDLKTRLIINMSTKIDYLGTIALNLKSVRLK